MNNFGIIRPRSKALRQIQINSVDADCGIAVSCVLERLLSEGKHYFEVSQVFGGNT